LYEMLLERSAQDVESGGPCWTVLRDQAAQGEKRGSALALRFMGSVHRLVLDDRAPELAVHYPSAGGVPDRDEDVWRAFRGTVGHHADELRLLVESRCQTNEVGRSAALVGGFLLVARNTGLRLRCLEIGASAGLNLRWDHYRYGKGDLSWGDPTSPVQLGPVYEGDGRPPFDTVASVAERGGCDLEPMDPLSEAGRLALRSFVWADQIERFGLLEGALRVARDVPASVERSDAAEWLEQQLHAPTDGLATVVFHSVVMDQLPLAARTRVRTAIEEAGARATRDAPMAWLRMEGKYSYALLRFLPHEVWLTSWPGGEERKVADTGAHGKPVRWMG
jgi:hypothetical protein